MKSTALALGMLFGTLTFTTAYAETTIIKKHGMDHSKKVIIKHHGVNGSSKKVVIKKHEE